MRLHFQVQGKGPPLLILHGLLGALDNWRSMAKRLATLRRVYSIDLRNHGRSPHSAIMNYWVMAEDIHEFCANEKLHAPAVLGHSLGGKIAMQVAGQYPDEIERLIVIDIAPKAYPPTHMPLLSAMRALDLGSFSSYAEIGAALAPAIPDPNVRQFVMKNLTRDTGEFRWRIGLEEIIDNYDGLTDPVEIFQPFTNPACFIRGDRSDFIADGDLSAIRRYFPTAELKTIAHAGHWVHVEAPDAFFTAVARFLRE
jgi:pimeloyl-ACP methyl ester carboxylesterase